MIGSPGYKLGVKITFFPLFCISLTLAFIVTVFDIIADVSAELCRVVVHSNQMVFDLVSYIVEPKADVKDKKSP